MTLGAKRKTRDDFAICALLIDLAANGHGQFGAGRKRSGEGPAQRACGGDSRLCADGAGRDERSQRAGTGRRQECGGKRRHVVDHPRGQVLRAVVDSIQRVFQRVARRCADRGAELPTARLTAAVRDALSVLISATLLVASQLMPVSSV